MLVELSISSTWDRAVSEEEKKGKKKGSLFHSDLHLNLDRGSRETTWDTSPREMASSLHMVPVRVVFHEVAGNSFVSCAHPVCRLPHTRSNTRR